MCISTASFIWVCSLPMCQWGNGWEVACVHSIKFSSLRQCQQHPYCQPEMAAFRLYLNIICYKCSLASAAGLTNQHLREMCCRKLSISNSWDITMQKQFTSSSDLFSEPLAVAQTTLWGFGET